MNDSLIPNLLKVSDNVSTTSEWITPLYEVVQEVPAAVAAWQPAPDERSIWEIVVHVQSWTDWLVAWLVGQDTEVDDWPIVADTSEAAWQAAQSSLSQSLTSLRARIAATPPEGIFDLPTPEVTQTDRFLGLSSILVHNAYHAGQITKLIERRRSLPSAG